MREVKKRREKSERKKEKNDKSWKLKSSRKALTYRAKLVSEVYNLVTN